MVKQLNFRARRFRRIRELKKKFGEYQTHLTPKHVRAGTKTVRTYGDWQALFKNPEVGGILEVAHLFTETEE